MRSVNLRGQILKEGKQNIIIKKKHVCVGRECKALEMGTLWCCQTNGHKNHYNHTKNLEFTPVFMRSLWETMYLFPTLFTNIIEMSEYV